MDIKIVINKENAERVAALAKVIWTEHYTPIIGANQVTYMLENFQSSETIWQAIKNEHIYWLIEEEQKDIGYVSYQLEANTLFLSKLYLKKSARGKKYGRKLLQYLVKIASEKKKETITLTVNKYNHHSIAAYQAMGFKKIREQVAEIGQGYVMDDYVLELEVNQIKASK